MHKKNTNSRNLYKTCKISIFLKVYHKFQYKVCIVRLPLLFVSYVQ